MVGRNSSGLSEGILCRWERLAAAETTCLGGGRAQPMAATAVVALRHVIFCPSFSLPASPPSHLLQRLQRFKVAVVLIVPAEHGDWQAVVGMWAGA